MSTASIPLSTYQFFSSKQRVRFAGFVLATALALCAILIGCGGGSSSSTTTSNPVTITLLPSTATVTIGTTEQFTATVTNASNTGVTYQVNNVTGGNSTTGTISTTGLYTPPATVPNPNTVEIEAVSQQDASEKATASVTITLPPPTTHIDIQPAGPTISAGAIQTFTASLNGKPLTTVSWSLGACTASAPNGCGTVNAQTGVYTAPLSPPPGGSISLIATDTNAADNTPAATTSITIQFSNGTLSGPYAFAVIGSSKAIAGTLTADGNGGFTAGSADINTSGSATSGNGLTGNYNLGTDGRGTLTTNLGVFAIAMVSHSHGYLLRRDSGFASMVGTIDAQDSSKFTLQALSGNYTIAFASHGGSFATQVAGAGAFQTDGTGAVNNGQFDVNVGGTVSSPGTTGSLALSGVPGRGTLTFGTRSFAFYIIDATHTKLIETDSTPGLGDMISQNPGPYTAASFNHTFAAVLNGFISGGPLAIGAVFGLNGNGAFSNAIFDVNQNGSGQNTAGVAGTYVVSDSITGRTAMTATINGANRTFIFYPEANGALNVIETDITAVASGTAFIQQSNASTNSVIVGHFAMTGAGTDLVTSPGEEDLVGQWLPSGGTTFNGTVDLNDNGGVTIGNLINNAASSYLIGQSGRAQGGSVVAGSFSAPNVNFYVVDANTVLFLEMDGNHVITGAMQKQY